MPLSYRRNASRGGRSRMYSAMRNPFASGAMAPKIPDGRVQLSVGQKFQQVNQITVDGTHTLAVFPGLAAGACSVPLGELASRTQGEQADGGSYFNYGGSHVELNNLSNPFLRLTSSNVIDKWRIVSQGIKLSLINNADENDGWFEAVRLTPGNNPVTDWCLVNLGNDNQDPPQPRPNGLYPLIQIDGSVFGTDPGNFIENPTYITGKFRDIHKFNFNLRPIDEHEFKNPAVEYSNALAAANAIGRLNQHTPSAKNVCNDLIDKSFDVLIIRIHGRTGNNSSKLVAHLACNQEVVYKTGTTAARFHTVGSTGGHNTVSNRSYLRRTTRRYRRRRFTRTTRRTRRRYRR